MVNSENTGGVVDRLQAERGRLIHELAHDASTEPKDIYRKKGKIAGLHVAIRHLTEDPEMTIDEEKYEQYQRLGELDMDVFDSLLDGDDPEPETESTDIGRGVQ